MRWGTSGASLGLRTVLGRSAGEQGDYAGSKAFHEESLALSRRVGDEAGNAKALNHLASWRGSKGSSSGPRS